MRKNTSGGTTSTINEDCIKKKRKPNHMFNVDSHFEHSYGQRLIPNRINECTFKMIK